MSVKRPATWTRLRPSSSLRTPFIGSTKPCGPISSSRLAGPKVAQRFGYTLGSLHQLVHEFRHGPSRTFFAEPPPRGAKASDPVREQIVRLRKQNLSVYDISKPLKKEGIGRTPVAVAAVLKKEGFADCRDARTTNDRRAPTHGRRPCRRAGPEPGGAGPFAPSSAACFFPADAGGDGVRPRHRPMWPARHPAVPATCALRSLLALKLFGTAAPQPRDECGA